MGLSEREQQLLDEMERSFYRSEADVVQTSAGAPRRFNMRSLVLGILLLIAGVGLLIAGVAIQQLWLGLIGFAAMVGGVVLSFAKSDTAESGPVPPGGAAAPRESLADRMERRWDQRMDGER